MHESKNNAAAKLITMCTLTNIHEHPCSNPSFDILKAIWAMIILNISNKVILFPKIAISCYDSFAHRSCISKTSIGPPF